MQCSYLPSLRLAPIIHIIKEDMFSKYHIINVFILLQLVNVYGVYSYDKIQDSLIVAVLVEFVQNKEEEHLL